MLTKNLNSLKTADKVRFEVTAEAVEVLAVHGGAVVCTTYWTYGDCDDSAPTVLEVAPSDLPANVVEVVLDGGDFVLVGDTVVRVSANGVSTFPRPAGNARYVCGLPLPAFREAVAGLNADGVAVVTCDARDVAVGGASFPVLFTEWTGSLTVPADLLKWAVENLDGRFVMLFVQDDGLLLVSQFTNVFVPVK